MATVSAMFTITDVGDLNGRNLIQRSFFTKEPWTGPTYNAVGDGFGTYHDKYCLPVTTNYLYSNTHSGKDNLFPDLAFEEGVRYTISGKWAQFRTDTKYNRLYLRIHHTDGTNVTAVQSNQNNVWSSFKLTSTAGKTVDKITMTYGEYGTTYIADFKLEVGAAATDWTPAPEDVNTALIDAKEAQSTADGADTKASTALETATGAVTAINDYIAGKEIVVGTQTEATNLWTGRAGFSELINGQEIAYWLPYGGLSSIAVTLTLTLADNSVTDAIPVYYKGTTRATTHFTAGTVVHLTYRENADVAGTTVANGWWADASYDSGNTNYYDRIRLNNAIKAKTAISASRFIVSDDEGYFPLAGSSVFDITKPILWCSTAISAGATGNNNYISLPSLTLRNNASGITLVANKTCYLVGTLSGKMFTVKSSGFFTATVPTSDDGYYYISFGYLYSTYQIYLYPEHPIYKFVNGSFKSLNQVAYEASVTADTKNSVYYQATAPTGNLKDGDTWFDTDNDYKISRWNAGTQEWVAAELGNQAIGNLNASHINSGTLTAVHIEAGKAQDIAGTINVYDEDDAVKVSLDKDGLVATKGKIGNWDISSYSIQYQEDTPSSEDTVIGGDEDEQLIESGTPTLVGGATLKLKICTYDPDNPNLGPHIISSVVENGVAPQYDNGKTMRISNGGLACYYNRNNGVTGGSVSINPKLINVINADYDEDQVLWTDSANLNPGSLTIIMSKTENGEQTSIGRSFLTYRDLSFLGDSANPQLASGIAHWSVLAARRTIKDELGVTVYHCGNLFWAHFDGKMTVGWAGRMEEYISIYPNDDASLTNSQLCAPPSMLEKYCLPQSPANPRAIYRVFPDGQLGLYHFIPPTNGTNNYEVLTYDNWEPCDIFWAHIG